MTVSRTAIPLGKVPRKGAGRGAAWRGHEGARRTFPFSLWHGGLCPSLLWASREQQQVPARPTWPGESAGQNPAYLQSGETEARAGRGGGRWAPAGRVRAGGWGPSAERSAARFRPVQEFSLCQ